MHDDDQHDELIARVADELRAPVALDPAFDARVMAEVRRAAPGRCGGRSGGGPSRGRSGCRRSSGWLARRGSRPCSSWCRVAASCAPSPMERCPGRPRVARTVEPGSEMVQFVLVAPQASSVAVVGDFNDWDPRRTPLRAEAAGGVWSVNVSLRSGQHQYAFVVDGKEWRPDPAAPRAVTDDFGSPIQSLW